MKYLLYYLIIINIITFFLYGIDKRKAIKNKKRIRETTLLLCSIMGGCFLGLISMYLYHHKTKKVKFVLGNLLLIILYSYLIWRYL